MVNPISGVKKGLKISNIKISKQNGFKEELQKLRTIERNSLEPVNVQMNNLESNVNHADKILQNIFHNLDSGHKKIESLLKLSLSGVKLNQQELLTLQMRVYRFTQEVELISKLVEKGTSGIKQVVNTQV